MIKRLTIAAAVIAGFAATALPAGATDTRAAQPILQTASDTGAAPVLAATFKHGRFKHRGRFGKRSGSFGRFGRYGHRHRHHDKHVGKKHRKHGKHHDHHGHGHTKKKVFVGPFVFFK